MPRLPKRVELLEPQGDPDKAVVDYYRRLHGLPPSAMVWVCQHSCAEASIPDCDAMNCEAAMIVDPCDIDVVRRLAEHQDFAAFDGVVVRLRLNFGSDVVAEIQALAAGQQGLPELTCGGLACMASGSLLAFARLCALAAAAWLSSAACTALTDIEAALVWQFSSIAPTLLRQRFRDLRTDSEARGNVITLLARGDFPARALLAWEEPAPYARRKAALPTQPSANAGFGLWTDQGLCMGLTTSDLHALPGDLYGPTSRVVFRVDSEVADKVRKYCGTYASALPDARRDEAMLEVLAWVVREIGLPAVVQPVRRGDESGDCALPARFIRRILWAQPLGAFRK